MNREKIKRPNNKFLQARLCSYLPSVDPTILKQLSKIGIKNVQDIYKIYWKTRNNKAKFQKWMEMFGDATNSQSSKYFDDFKRWDEHFGVRYRNLLNDGTIKKNDDIRAHGVILKTKGKTSSERMKNTFAQSELVKRNLFATGNLLLQNIDVEKTLEKPEIVSKKIENVTNSDPLTSFFQSTLDTVKTFSKSLQVQVKRQIFEIMVNVENKLADDELGPSASTTIPYYSPVRDLQRQTLSPELIDFEQDNTACAMFGLSSDDDEQSIGSPPTHTEIIQEKNITRSPSYERTENKPYTICDAKRNKKQEIMVASLEDLLSKVPGKLGLPFKNLTVTLESNGTEVDDEEYFSTLDPKTPLMILHGDEKWSPVVPKLKVSLDQTDDAAFGNKKRELKLVSRLQHNMLGILLLGEQDLELLSDMDPDSLAVCFTGQDNRTLLEHIKEASGRILFEKRQAQDAIEILKLYNQLKNESPIQQENKRRLETSPEAEDEDIDGKRRRLETSSEAKDDDIDELNVPHQLSQPAAGSGSMDVLSDVEDTDRQPGAMEKGEESKQKGTSQDESKEKDDSEEESGIEEEYDSEEYYESVKADELTKDDELIEDDEPEDHWEWWQDDDTYNLLARGGQPWSWKTLEHKGPVVPYHYMPLPHYVRLLYDGEEMLLSEEAEEVAFAYACILWKVKNLKKLNIMMDNRFNSNFLTDWRNIMKPHESQLINDLSKCNFKIMEDFYAKTYAHRCKTELMKKKALRERYGFCIINDRKQPLHSYIIEPPNIVVGRHPNRGMWKKRVMPEDVVINCSKNKIPDPPSGHKWKEVIHDNSVSWLSCWDVHLDNRVKMRRYTTLHPSSGLKAMKDFQKYETARKLDKCIERFRDDYRAYYTSPNNMYRQQCGVALYIIDRLARRDDNEKNNYIMNPVSCCSLRVKHIHLYESSEEPKTYEVALNFLGIQLDRNISVDKDVFQKLKHFTENKSNNSLLFERVSSLDLNLYLKKYDIPSFKVFHTYIASSEMERRLLRNRSTDVNELDNLSEANEEATILSYHQRIVAGIGNTDLAYYIDPRIMVSWCKKNNIPIERVYPPSLKMKFTWAIQKDQGESYFLFAESNRQYLQ